MYIKKIRKNQHLQHYSITVVYIILQRQLDALHITINTVLLLLQSPGYRH